MLWGTVFKLGGLLLLRWSCGAGRPRGRHVLIHPIELRLQLNQFAEFLARMVAAKFHSLRPALCRGRLSGLFWRAASPRSPPAIQ